MRDPLAGGFAVLLAIICNRAAGRTSPGAVLFLLAALAGYAYASARLPSVPESVPVARQGVVLSGAVDSVEEKPGGRLEIILEDAAVSDSHGPAQPLAGRTVWTWQDPSLRPTLGSRVELKARPLPAGGFDNPGGSDWGFRWRAQGVFHRVYTRGPKAVAVTRQAPEGAVHSWRLSLREAILAGAGGGSAAGMVLGLVTGERYAISPEDLDRVRRASLSHLLAVSGMNLTAVVAMGWLAAWAAGLAWPGLYLRLPRPKLAVILSIPLVAGYLWMARFEPSLTRAALMFAAWGALLMLGRSNVLLDGLFYALAAMFAFDPLCVFDVGLRLSACAVAGLILLVPLAAPLVRRIRGRGAWRLAAAMVPGWIAVTLAAQLAVLPVQLSVFGESSPHIYLNLLWVPVVEWAAQPLAYVGALTVTWLPGVGEALLGLSGKVCSMLLASLQAMDARGWLGVSPTWRPWQPEVLGYFLLLGFLPWVATAGARRRLAWLGLCATLLAGPWLWRAWEQGRDTVRLTMLDVGQGQAVLIEAQGGRRWLVDGGGSASETFDLGRAVLAPVLTWGRFPSLTGAVMSHPDRDHTGGLCYIVEKFGLGFLAGNGELPRFQDFTDALAASGLAPLVWRSGERVDLGGGLWFEVASPPEGSPLRGNDASLVLRLVWRGRGLALLPGDAGTAVLEGLAASGAELSADVLAVPHHGSANALAPGFYARAGAKWALVSSAQGNRYGFPAKAVTQALGRAGAQVEGTAERGAITAEWASPDEPPVVGFMR